MQKRIMTVEIEVCVDSVEGALAASHHRAARVECCSNISAGGTTPSAGLISATKEAYIATGSNTELYVMIRPRPGDFTYSSEEVDVMRRDIRIAKELGANGIVLGCLHARCSTVDVPLTTSLVELAKPMSVTFHRAFDWTPNATEALMAVIQTGAKRILTSGLAPSVVEGMKTIAQLSQKAQGHIDIMAGCGVRPDNVKRLVQETKVQAIHFTARKMEPMSTGVNTVTIPMGIQEDQHHWVVDHNKLRGVKEALKDET
jgi:copper homeostasis protein